MDKLKQVNVTRRLIWAFSILVLIFILFGMFTIYDIHTVSELTRTIYNHPLAVSNAALQSNVSITKIHRNMKDVVLFTSPSEINRSIEAVNEQEKQVYNYLDIVKERIIGNEGKILENEARKLFDTWRPIREEVIEFVRRGKKEIAAGITIGRGANHVALLEEKMLGLTAYAREKASGFMHETERLHSRLNLTWIIFLLLGVLTSLLVAFFTIRRTASAERALQESEERYRRFVENVPVAVYRNEPDLKGKFLMANPTFLKMFGLDSEEELKEMSVADLYMNPDERKAFSDNVRAKGKATEVELLLKKKDETPFWGSVSARIMDDESGKGSYFDCTIVDITNRKQAEEELQESEKRFRTIYENAPVLIYSFDKDGRCILWNKMCEKRFGWTMEEINTYDNPLSLFYPDPEIQEQVRDSLTLKSEEVFREWHPMTKDGSELVTLWANFRLPDGTVINIGYDITENRREEEALREREEKLARSKKMEAIGLMAGGVAHDLNNILSGIVSYPELLLMDLPEDSPLREPIKTIKESGMRAADVVEDLLTIARGVAGGKEVLNLNTVVEEYLDSAEHHKLERIHPLTTFKTEFDAELLNIAGSVSHVKKVLMNLIVNASEAIVGTGTVTVSTVNRYLDEPLKGYEDVRTGEYVVLAISDNGSGISPQDLDRIFEPFYTKKVMGRSGTGLGLAVVWNSMQDHDGYINVKSSGKGTVFKLYFPTTREQVADEKEQVPLEDYLGHGENILVVDDEERQRKIACVMLTKLGYTAETVSSGEEAIEYIKQNPVDLIVLDMVMPKGINGRETYEQIIKIRPGQKAVIASGYAKTKEVDIAQGLGAGKYIRKPYVLEKIGLAVKEELGK